jgi:hypothetical protein
MVSCSGDYVSLVDPTIANMASWISFGSLGHFSETSLSLFHISCVPSSLTR